MALELVDYLLKDKCPSKTALYIMVTTVRLEDVLKRFDEEYRDDTFSWKFAPTIIAAGSGHLKSLKYLHKN